MGSVFWLLGHPDFPIRSEQARQVVWQALWAQKQAKILANRDQASIEQPMKGPGKGQPIPKGIRPIGGHRTDVGSLDFRPPPTVNQRQP